MIAHIESGHFESTKLKQLQATLKGASQPASIAIRRLGYIISQLNVRYNFFAIFLNLYALWDLQWVYRLEQWKIEYRDTLARWFHTLAEFEALGSLATTLSNNPDWTFPVIRKESELIGHALGHPLIHIDKRKCNDLQMPTSGHIKLITGSNMAGKSTLLRTVGLNIVLAMAGAPVCARFLVLPALRVYTSMRTQDALHESTSSFYAELKRLKFIIEAVERREPVFFLLDEILKGTNSHDRHSGSKALILQLIRNGGGGLIATHDLELGGLEAQYPEAIENLCMEVAIRDDKLFFDYTLKKGVSQSFNATLLMKNMGIKME
jgi:DNA mismatch repair ATPase MutS